MTILATAGHVDHGKSALVHRLTGREPDRLAEERRRGVSIELGHSHLTLPSGRVLSVVDAPGHEDFLATTVRGLQGCDTVLFVVAADEGWSAQSTEHLGVLHALGLHDVVVAVTKSDLHDPAPALTQVRDRFGVSGPAPRALLAVSSRTGQGWPGLLAALDAPVAHPGPAPGAAPRLWVDRSFTVRGAGTVVTGSLRRGVLGVGDHVHLGGRALRVREVHRHDTAVDRVEGPTRVALNLARVSPGEVPRGSLLTTGPAPATRRHEGRLLPVAPPRRWPRATLAGVGTASVQVHLHVHADTVHLTFPDPLALLPGEHVVLRDPGGRHVLAGVRLTGAPVTGPSRTTAPGAPEPDPPGVRALLAHLEASPLDAPDQDRLQAWGLTPAAVRSLAAQGRVLHLGQGRVVHRDAARDAWVVLTRLPQPFSTSAAREALGVGRRTTIALLGHLDASGLTVAREGHLRRTLNPRRTGPLPERP